MSVRSGPGFRSRSEPPRAESASRASRKNSSPRLSTAVTSRRSRTRRVSPAWRLSSRSFLSGARFSSRSGCEIVTSVRGPVRVREIPMGFLGCGLRDDRSLGLLKELDQVAEVGVEDLHDLRIQMAPRRAPYVAADLVGRQRPAVGAVAGERIERIGNRDDPGDERYGPGGESRGITASVPALVMVADPLERRRELRNVPDDLD